MTVESWGVMGLIRDSSLGGSILDMGKHNESHVDGLVDMSFLSLIVRMVD